ncbi:helix-turn-helix domain-containing protein [Nocardia sp. NBC_00403]|uniref:helix-turn-helix domain-containing protein n=1 Tax=Nocardia sp. NBC_00403 TaxID=2975990 RepID=UPI003FA5B4E6
MGGVISYGPDFLRTRRARADPGSVGIPVDSRRRVEGLRREEVAHLSGVSVDYYVRLEQGRATQPSAQVLDALCPGPRARRGGERAPAPARAQDAACGEVGAGGGFGPSWYACSISSPRAPRSSSTTGSL